MNDSREEMEIFLDSMVQDLIDDCKESKLPLVRKIKVLLSLSQKLNKLQRPHLRKTSLEIAENISKNGIFKIDFKKMSPEEKKDYVEPRLSPFLDSVKPWKN